MRSSIMMTDNNLCICVVIVSRRSYFQGYPQLRLANISFLSYCQYICILCYLARVVPWPNLLKRAIGAPPHPPPD